MTIGYRGLSRTIQVGAYEETDERTPEGNFITRFVFREVDVYAIAPGTSEEPEVRHRDEVVTGWTIYAPVGTVVSAHDVIRLPEVEGDCQVIGETAVWDHSPYGSPLGNVGVVIKVEKVDG